MAEIVDISGRAGRNPIDPNDVLDAAMGRVSPVVVLGIETSTGEIFIATSSGDMPWNHWLMLRAAANVAETIEAQLPARPEPGGQGGPAAR